MNKLLKISIGIKAEDPPFFMEGEERGVFYSKVFEIEDDKFSDPMFAKFVLDEEAKALKECIHVRVKTFGGTTELEADEDRLNEELGADVLKELGGG